MAFKKMGLARRLLFFYAIIFITVLMAADWTLSKILQARDFQKLQDNLSRQSMLIREIAAPLLKTPPKLQTEIKKLAVATGVRITIVNDRGMVLADSSEAEEAISRMENHATRPEIAAALRGAIGTSTRYSMTLKSPMLYLAFPISEGSQILGVVRTAMQKTQIYEILNPIRSLVLLTAVLSIGIILLISFFYSRHLANRIGSITSVAERYAKGDLSQKILIGGRDELKMLAETMNQMALSLRLKIAALENEQTKIAAILRHMSEGILAIDRQKHCVLANPAAEKFFSCRSEEVLGKSLLEITRNLEVEKIVDRAFREQKNLTGGIRIMAPEEKELFVQVVIMQSMQNLGGILVFHDVTELRRFEKTRKEFVANVSHELRTPLTSIKGFIETLLHQPPKDAKTYEKFLTTLTEETDRLTRLVEDILTLSEIEQKELLMKKDRLDLSLEFERVLESFQTQIQRKNIAVQNETAGQTLIATGDRDKIHQVFSNLIDNAIKFNRPRGSIKIHGCSKSEGVTLTIEDTGIGIPEEATKRVFERFFRVDKTRSKELGGTGLGLAIVKHIMEAHGGRAFCESRLGQGTSFSVFFPA